MLYGYVRVSTKEQNEERQLVAMREYGVNEQKIYLDKQSGKWYPCHCGRECVQESSI